MSCVLAFDLGGSGLRAALVDDKGAMLASHFVTMPVVAGAGGVCEADPDIWWKALCTCAQALAQAETIAFGQIAAIAISAFTRSQVFTGRDGKALRPALLWGDTRCAAALDTLRALCPGDHPEYSALNVFHPLARLYWLKHMQPDIWQAMAHVLEPKDYLNLRLTGRAAGDTISSARLATAALHSASGVSLFEAADIPARLLSPLADPLSIMGRVQPGLDGALDKLAGVPVIAMANDTWASVLGLGALRKGFGYNLSGTTEVLGVLGEASASAEGLLTLDWGSGLTQIGGPSQNGGDTLVWLLELLGSAQVDPKQTGGALTQILAGPRSCEPLLFLPYLQGERTPFWDASLRGAFIGLSRRHGAADFAWAVMEGIAFVNRLVLERAEAASGEAVTEIRFGGGGAANDLWRQIKADVLNRPVAVTEGSEHGLAGAAIAAFTALGRFADLDAAQTALARVSQRALPQPGKRRHYDALYVLFCEAHERLAPVSRSLAGWNAGAPAHA